MVDTRTTRSIEINFLTEKIGEIQYNHCTHINNNQIQYLDIIYTNVDCFTNKKQELNLFLASLNSKPSVIVITEVNPKTLMSGLFESEFSIHGYNMSCDKIKHR